MVEAKTGHFEVISNLPLILLKIRKNSRNSNPPVSEENQLNNLDMFETLLNLVFKLIFDLQVQIFSKHTD